MNNVLRLMSHMTNTFQRPNSHSAPTQEEDNEVLKNLSTECTYIISLWPPRNLSARQTALRRTIR